MKNANERLTEC